MDKAHDTKRIAKNTTFLYIRMIVIMLVQFFTIRVTLKYLGIDNYGIYNVVCGVTNVFTFLTHTMTSASQRFFAYDIGCNNLENLRKTFDTTLLTFLCLALAMTLLLQTFGSWFVSHKLVIPAQRHDAAMIAFLYTNIMLFITIMTIPINSLIIAHEDISIFAYISIIDVLIKLGVVYLLIVLPFDKLETYAFLLMLTSLINPVLFWIYAYKHYPECDKTFSLDVGIIKQLIPFMSWNLFGGISWMLCTQGLSILINLFFGPILNAAKAIADKINSALSGFYNSFIIATQPQMVKTYAANEMNEMHKVYFFASNVGCFLLYIINIPIIFNTDAILKIWLSTFPEQTPQMTQLVLSFTFISALEQPITQAIRATGKIKEYQWKLSLITLLVVPVAFAFFKIGLPAFWAFWSLIIIYSLALIYRIYFLKLQIGINYTTYFKEIVVKQIKCIVPIIIVNIIIKHIIYSTNIFYLILSILIECIVTLSIIYILGLDREEKVAVKRLFLKR